MITYRCSCGNIIYDLGNEYISELPMKGCCREFISDIDKRKNYKINNKTIQETHNENYNTLLSYIKEIFTDSKFKTSTDKTVYIKNNKYISKVKLYTARHEYIISLITDNNNSSYIGCICNNRYRLVDEDHIRSNDLSDGKFTRELFDTIIKDIVRTEIGSIVFQY